MAHFLENPSLDMTNTLLILTEDEFIARYPLVENHLNTSACWTVGGSRGCLFEAYGEELAFVRQQDPARIWTLVDSRDGEDLIVSGFRLANRIGYLISQTPVSEGVSIYVRIPRDVENPANVWDEDYQ